MGKNKIKHYDLIVIGAGASGMMAAIIAAQNNKKVCILEKLNKPGKKLLATGNGKCNFTNAHMNEDCFGGDRVFIKQVLDTFSVDDCLSFFHSIGIYPKNKNGYYYPNSEQAVSVVNALVRELERLRVRVFLETIVNDICPQSNQVIIETNQGPFIGEKVIIATGLLAAPKLGSDGSMFEIIKGLGHRFQPILPVLCGFICKTIDFKKVSGVRANGTVTAYVDGAKIAEDTGEIQFTNYGLSGIPMFQISRYLSKGIYNKLKVEVAINLLPAFDKDQLLEELNYRKLICINQSVDHLLNGLVHELLSDVVLRKAHLDKSMFASSLTEKDIAQIADILQELRVVVTNYRDFEFAQVCTGGISPEEIHMDTLESKLVPNVYFTGEILDVDGICGGYNLHFAWATGYIAGKSVV